MESGITFDPKLLSLSSNEGSAAGSVITAVVKGVGVNDEITLIDAASKRDVCETTRVTSYGILECKTIAEEFSSAIELSVKELTSNKIRNLLRTHSIPRMSIINHYSLQLIKAVHL